VFADLLAHPGVEEECRLGSRFGILAFHGGNLERGTDDIAVDAADASDASLYVVRQPPDLRWHVPSVAFDPAVSPALAAFLEHVRVAVAVHGYGRDGMWTTLLLGGRNRELATDLGTELRVGLGDGFTVIDELEDVPPELRGVHGRNPVNRPSDAGVQLELPPRVRPGTGVPTFDPGWPATIAQAIGRVARRWT
jgi:phage replication-related protein YjqB (UPF0714/DUF867 family)